MADGLFSRFDQTDCSFSPDNKMVITGCAISCGFSGSVGAITKWAPGFGYASLKVRIRTLILSKEFHKKFNILNIYF
jgi:hypothetical protein